ncbi:MAG: SCP2 sterol-binding domain-containing protein [Thermoplasmata archaeon]
MGEKDLKEVLYDFVNNVNKNEKVQKLIKKWSTTLLFWGKDINKGFILQIQDGKIISIKEVYDENEGKVKVITEKDTLVKMFEGKENIAHLYLDGVVETYGSEKDQIVLDAVARLLWK